MAKRDYELHFNSLDSDSAQEDNRAKALKEAEYWLSRPAKERFKKLSASGNRSMVPKQPQDLRK
jgi:hypothetical protein